MGQIKFISGLLMASLFAIALIGFSINFANDNSSVINIASDSDLSGVKGNMEGDMQQFYLDANTSSSSMYESTISTQTEATEGGTSFKVGPATALTTGNRVLSTGFKKIFGADANFGIFLTSLIAMLGLIAALFIWKAWKGGQVD